MNLDICFTWLCFSQSCCWQIWAQRGDKGVGGGGGGRRWVGVGTRERGNKYKHCWISIFFSKCKVTSRTLDHREHGYYYTLFTNVKLHRSISERFSSEHFLQVWRLVTGESAIGAHLPSIPLFCLTCHTVRSCTVALLLLMCLLIHTEIKLIFQFPSSPPGIVIRLN